MFVLIVCSVSPVVATSIGAITGAFVNFVWQRTITFPSSRTAFLHALPYALLVCAGWSLNSTIFKWVFDNLSTNVASAQLLTTALVAVFNFFMTRRIFRS
ncbi:GtrA family protein [Pigmentiphaga sp. D-2]